MAYDWFVIKRMTGVKGAEYMRILRKTIRIPSEMWGDTDFSGVSVAVSGGGLHIKIEKSENLDSFPVYTEPNGTKKIGGKAIEKLWEGIRKNYKPVPYRDNNAYFAYTIKEKTKNHLIFELKIEK